MTKHTLKRSLSLPMMVFYGLGNILGAGIYVLIGEVSATAGAYVPFAFLLSAIIVSFTSFTYAELSARFPESSGEAAYIFHGFQLKELATFIGLMICLSGIVSSATISHGFVGYIGHFIQLPDYFMIIAMFAVLGLLAIWGISESITVASMFTILEIAGLLYIIYLARDQVFVMDGHWSKMGFPSDAKSIGGIFMGAFLAFYAYLGFEDMVNVAEEVKDPSRNMPRAIFISLIVSSVIYVLIAAAASFTVPIEVLANSEAPLATVYTHITGKDPTFISIIGVFAVINGALIQIIMASRLIYGMSNRKWLPSIFSKIHPRTRTPINATIFVVFLMLTFALFFEMVTLASMTSAMVLSVFALVNWALIRIKKHSPTADHVKVYPFWIPYAGFWLCVGFLSIQSFLLIIY